MVMKPEPIFEAFDQNNLWKGKKIFLSPQGVPLNHDLAVELSKEHHLVILCGHYEGIDQRVVDKMDMEVSIGDYVISNGAVAATVLIDALTRHIPNALGNSESAECDSFADGLLEYPQYTRPEQYRGMSVPEVLLSGNHEEIRKWRRKQSIIKTYQKRPDLLEKICLSEDEKKILNEIKH